MRRHAQASPLSLLRRTGPFILWLAAFYLIWLGLVIVGDGWATLREHWGIAVAMAVGSYVAGSTPMGGGTIGFPILVLLFGEPAALGRDFSFAVQSVGMVSASIFVLSVRRPLAWRVLRWAMLGSLIAVPLGSAFLAPHVSDLNIKLLFAVLWASFGIMHLIKVREIVAVFGFTLGTAAFDRAAGLLIGLIGGGVVASVTGVGIDVLLYVFLVLVARCDIRIAIPTSVVIMAFTSLVGIGTRIALDAIAPAPYALSPEVYRNWLAAAPVVALGAPFGVLMVNLIPRVYTLIIVSLLCIGHFLWTCVNERLSLPLVLAAIASVFLFNVVYYALYRWGKARAAASRSSEAPSMEGAPVIPGTAGLSGVDD